MRSRSELRHGSKGLARRGENMMSFRRRLRSFSKFSGI